MQSSPVGLGLVIGRQQSSPVGLGSVVGRQQSSPVGLGSVVGRQRSSPGALRGGIRRGRLESGRRHQLSMMPPQTQSARYVLLRKFAGPICIDRAPDLLRFWMVWRGHDWGRSGTGQMRLRFMLVVVRTQRPSTTSH